MTEGRCYPPRPVLAVSAAIFRGGKVLLVRRAHPPGQGLLTLPGGAVEAGETLRQALIRETREETGLSIAPVALAGHREVIARDPADRVERHFVILAFAARWLAGEPMPSAEVDQCHWLDPAEVATLETTEGLAEIVAAALAQLGKKPDQAPG